MTKLHLVKEGMFSTQYEIFEDNNYIGEAFAYAEDLGNTFIINLTWCLFIQPKGNIISLIQNYEYILLDDIEKGLNCGFYEPRHWEYKTRVIQKGKVLELKELGSNY